MGREAGRAAIRGVAERQTRLSPWTELNWRKEWMYAVTKEYVMRKLEHLFWNTDSEKEPQCVYFYFLIAYLY